MKAFGATLAVDRSALVHVADRGQVQPTRIADELRLTALGTQAVQAGVKVFRRKQDMLLDAIEGTMGRRP